MTRITTELDAELYKLLRVKLANDGFTSAHVVRLAIADYVSDKRPRTARRARYTAERGRNEPDTWYVKLIADGQIIAQCAIESDAKLIASALNAQ